MSFKLLMRFRNLGEDNVIYKHSEIIQNNKFSWGGWWAKYNENLPLKGIKLIEEEIANNKKMTLFLLDSDTGLLHSAEIDEVRYSSEGKKINSPEKDYTPEYYKDAELFLWFRMTSLTINDTSNSILQNSYADNSLFNVSEDLDFENYDNIKVGTINEIRTQRRSLVLLRDSRPDDKAYEVLRNSSSIFSNSFSTTNSNEILLFSDIHFSDEKNRFAFSDCSNVRTINTLSKAIGDAIGNRKFAASICAGDLTFRSSEEEYKKAESFLFNLSNTYSIDRHNIIFVPGNHDFEFQENDNPEVINALPSAKKLYGEVFRKFYGKNQNEFYCVGRRFLLKNKLPIEIVGLNSNVLQQDNEHFKGIGFVGSDQLEFIANKMKWTDRPDSNYAFRIMVLHHHLFPVDWSQEPKKDFAYSICLDSGMILSFAAKYKIDLIVHGHKHKWNFIQTTGKTDEDLYTLNILGLGSAGSKDVGNADGNSIGILDFSEGNWLNISILALSENGPARNSKLFTRRIPINHAK